MKIEEKTMEQPKFDAYMVPILSVMNDGTARTRSQKIELSAASMKLADDIKNEQVKTGQLRYRNNAGWAITYLNQAGLLDRVKFGTYEINDEMESFTRPRIEASPWADKIDFCIGDVLTDLPENYKQGKQKFDLIFMDGNKRQYLDYYRLCLSVLSSNGLLLADNTLWDGHIIDSAYDRDEQTLGIRRFNDFLARDQRISKVILPLRDGLTMIKFREEEKQ